jgi:hypothetical protein
MEASIITMTSTYNYGATLQAYALHEYIRMQGHPCYIIDHMGWTGHRTLKLSDFSIDMVLKMPYKKMIEEGYRNFEKFYSEYMHMTKRYTSIEELHLNPPKSDVFFTGSDQVWNPRDLRGEFYLDFAPTQSVKASYAASIGVPSIPEDKEEIIGTYLKNMDFISVRETSGYNNIKKLTNKEVVQNCDPVFLLNRDMWKNVEKQVEGINEEYILCYMIYKPEWFNDWIKKIKKITNKRIIFVGLNGFRPVICDKYVRTAGPREFLWLIDHASGVVSSSFHGIAFSVLFGKSFIAIPDPLRPDRICNLLNLFKLEDNVLYNNNTEKCFEDYSYQSVQDVITMEQNKSLSYFNKIFAKRKGI